MLEIKLIMVHDKKTVTLKYVQLEIIDKLKIFTYLYRIAAMGAEILPIRSIPCFQSFYVRTSVLDSIQGKFYLIGPKKFVKEQFFTLAFFFNPPLRRPLAEKR